MTRFSVAVAALSTAALLAIPASAAPLGNGDHTIRLAQSESVTITEKSPVVRKKVIVHKPMVREKVVVRKPVVHSTVVVGARPGCKMVTKKVQEGGKTVVKKVSTC